MERSKNLVRMLKEQNKTVLIDACLPLGLAEGLRKRGLQVRHMYEIDSSLPDEQVAKLMLPSDVLLTRDYKFYKQEEDRAIHMPLACIDGRESKSGADEVKQRMKEYRHKGTFKLWQAEELEGKYDFRIKRGMRINFFRKATKQERISGKGDYIPI